MAPRFLPRLTSPLGFCLVSVPCGIAAGIIAWVASGNFGSCLPALLTAAFACSVQGVVLSRALKPLRALGAESDPLGWSAAELVRLREEREAAAARGADRSAREHASGQELTRLFDEMSAGQEGSMESIGETASALGVLQDGIRDVAANTEEAVELANRTKTVASSEVQNVLDSLGKLRQIQEVVEESGGSMQRLQSASEQIGQMVGIIEDIADQTNLLALNAAIEAARAGDQGRGFAVVADEVRKLAEKTVAATRKINEVVAAIQTTARSAVDIMNKGVEGVGSGVEIITNTGEALADIENLMNDLATKIEGIAAATEQQAAGTSQINGTLETMTTAARRAAVQVEQASEFVFELAKPAGS